MGWFYVPVLRCRVAYTLGMVPQAKEPWLGGWMEGPEKLFAFAFDSP